MRRLTESSTIPGALVAALLAVGCSGHLDLGDEVGSGGSTASAGAGGSVSGGSGSAFGGSGGPQPASCASLPTSGWIAFDSDAAEFNRDIYRMRPDGSGVERLTEEPGVDEQPSFSADGSSLVFTSDRSGSRQLHLLDIQSGEVTQVTQPPGEASQGSLSHDGKRVAFNRGSSVYWLDLESGVEQHVATGPDQFNSYAWPQFSLDDSELYYDRGNEIDASALDGSAMRMVVQNSTTKIEAPALSPDGREVAYHVWCDDGLSLWTSPSNVKTDPCKGRRVSPVGGGEARQPTWGSSQLIAYEHLDKALNVARIAIVSRVAGSQACMLTPQGPDARNPSWFIAEE